MRDNIYIIHIIIKCILLCTYDIPQIILILYIYRYLTDENMFYLHYRLHKTSYTGKKDKN